MRQQFSNEINVRISQFAADFVKNFRTYMGDDARVPQPRLHSFGYMYLADTEAFAATLRDSQKVQAALGAGTQFMTRDEIAQAYPFYQLDDIIGGQPQPRGRGLFRRQHPVRLVEALGPRTRRRIHRQRSGGDHEERRRHPRGQRDADDGRGRCPAALW